MMCGIKWWILSGAGQRKPRSASDDFRSGWALEPASSTTGASDMGERQSLRSHGPCWHGAHLSRLLRVVTAPQSDLGHLHHRQPNPATYFRLFQLDREPGSAFPDWNPHQPALQLVVFHSAFGRRRMPYTLGPSPPHLVRRPPLTVRTGRHKVRFARDSGVSGNPNRNRKIGRTMFCWVRGGKCS
jgi:hypothetical protein